MCYTGVFSDLVRIIYGECSSMVERWTVAPDVAGSIPVTHPNL